MFKQVMKKIGVIFFSAHSTNLRFNTIRCFPATYSGW